MKVIAPIRDPEQYDQLVTSGATELYGGVLDDNWNKKYGTQIEYNRRGNFSKQANLANYEALRLVLRRAACDGVAFYLTMNAIGVTEEQAPELQGILKRYMDIGGRKVIVGNWLMMQLALEASCEVTVSSCAGIYNHRTACFWEHAGAERLILPRAVGVETVREIANHCEADTELEVFMMNSGCKFSDSMCRSLHNTDLGALCSFLDRRNKSYLDVWGNELTGRDISKMKNASFFYRQLYTGNCSMGCGQCAIWDLMQSGVDSVKIVGRLMDTSQVVKCVAVTAQNIIQARKACSKEAYLAAMVSPEEVLQVQLCKNHTSCYYRE